MAGMTERAALLAAVLAAGLGTGALAQELDLHRLEAVADSVAEARLHRPVSPGLSVAVAVDGDIVFSKGYGLADAEQDVPASPETVYRIGSITKQFTAAAIMRLVEAGELSLEDPITAFLPDYPVQGHEVTLRHLLNHTSGIKSYTGLDESHWQREFRLDLTHDEVMELFAELPFDFEPGARYSYNNSAYYLLGVIIENVTGTSYPEYIERSLFDPLGLNHTLYCDVRRIVPDRAEGYEYDGGELVNAAYLSMDIPGAAGALCSTVGDLVDWTRMLHDGDVVSPGSFEAMTAPTVLTTGDTTGYGFGLALGELEGHRWIAHGGGINGFASYLAYYPVEALTIAVLTNSGSGQPAQYAEKLARAAFGLELPTVKDLPVGEEEIARYVGTYALDLGERILDIRVFADDDGGLMAQATGQNAFHLRYQGDHVFIPTFDDTVRLVFNMEDGQAASVTLHQGGAVVQGERKP